MGLSALGRRCFVRFAQTERGTDGIEETTRYFDWQDAQAVEHWLFQYAGLHRLLPDPNRKEGITKAVGCVDFLD